MAAPDRIDTRAVLAGVDIVEVVRRYLGDGLRRDGAEWAACCPFHTEATPSFKVNPAKQMYHCFGCGANGDAIKFVRDYERVGFRKAVEILGGGAFVPTSRPAASPAPPARKASGEWTPIVPADADAFAAKLNHGHRGTPEAVYTYRDQQGRLLGYTRRFRTSDGGKDVLPLTWARNEAGERMWRDLSFPVPRPLYGLDRLAGGKPVLIVEGEKCVDVASAQVETDFVVVSWPGGGKAVDKADWSPLAGRIVAIWPDCDAKRVKLTREETAVGVDPLSKPLLPEAEQPGMKAARLIIARLHALEPPAVVNLVAIPRPGDKPDGWDIADAIGEGLIGDALVAHIRKGSVYIAPEAHRTQTCRTDDGPPPPATVSHGSGRVARLGGDTARPGGGPDDGGGGGEGRPEVKIGPDRLISAMLEAERVLFAGTDPPFFERGGILTRTAYIDRVRERQGEVVVEPGALTLVPVNVGWLRRRMQVACKFMSWNSRAESWLPCNLPKEYAESYIDGNEWMVPVLRAVVEAPVLRPDGSIMSRPGFDPKTGIYLASDVKWKLPPARTKGEKIDPGTDTAVQWARAQFEDLFNPFKPEAGADIAVLITAVLTGLVKTMCGPAPGFIITAPVFGSGKGKLADIIGIILTGRTVPMMTMPVDSKGKADEKEFKKALFATLLGGERIVCIDEVNRTLASPTLDSMLTQETVFDRVLGVSKNATVRPTDSLFLALGNNVTVSADSSRRWLRCYLNPNCADPHLRVFDRDAILHAKENRVKLVCAALTLLHAYVVAGSPDMGVRLGSFERWAALVPSTVRWLGLPDPCKTQEAWKEQDEDRADLARLLEAWAECYGNLPMTAQAVCREVLERPKSEPHAKLGEVLKDICGEKTGYNPNRLGVHLSRKGKRVVDGKRFEDAGKVSHKTQWKVVEVGKA
ncbi:CHC2 zinc finger [Methylomagnum ishizawai]|uniref:CHC2 zinc finger n=1 Tax=Methylomagnum ishizawai TaxID=1760988 RepID=A0A1Y6D176_9GAMM|nr:CHC2 zinc finger domain-containing protein [Methylomagnum ishizawai]SMF94593.1 CHC2 zinc finger [Methylomagnum ishizawai]